MRSKSEIKVRFSFGRRAAVVVTALSVVALLAGWLPTGRSAASAADGATGGGFDVVVTEVPPGSGVGTGADPMPCAPGSRLVRVDAAGGQTVLSSGLETACDPALDPGATYLVFRGRTSASAPWRIWRLGLAAVGTGAPAEAPPRLTALTPETMSCVRPLVLADGGVGFLCDGDLVRTPPDATGGPEGADGTDGEAGLMRLTSSGGTLDAVAVLPDGRLLLTTRNAAGAPTLLTSQPDGTWTTRWRDDPVPGLLGARPLPPDALLLTVSADGSSDGGRLWLGSLVDPFAALRPLGSLEDGVLVRDPSPLPGGGLLAAVRPAPGEPFRIARLTPSGEEAGPVASLDGDALQPIALLPRAPDTQIPSIVKPELNTGYLVLFDAARTDVPALAGLDRRDVAAVRVFPWGDGPSAESAVDVAPAEDGSLHLEVPADRPLGIALVDGAGGLLGPAGGPFWVRPNERRACMGCHVSRRYAPPNVRPQALLDPPRWIGWGAERVSPRSEFEEGSH